MRPPRGLGDVYKRQQQSMPVTIVVPGSSTVFATGSYEVLCDIDTSEGAG